MAAMNLQNNIVMSKSLLKHCQKLLPEIIFIESNNYYWSPRNKSIHFDNDLLTQQKGQWALLHEVAHAQLKHDSYLNDAGLIKLEVQAWQKAVITADELSISIDQEHIQSCLNTYRDWLYARSTCPTCSLNSIQVLSTTYVCLNCSTRWTVSHSRFCRPYRMKIQNLTSPVNA